MKKQGRVFIIPKKISNEVKKIMIKERIDQLNDYRYFKEKPGLAEKLAHVEWKTGIKIPNTFREVMMPDYTFGKLTIRLGKIGPYYVFAVSENEKPFLYEVFDTKQSFKLFFTKSEMDPTLRAYFLREIEEIPNII